ncbi:FtsX-like permease family protein [Flavihumibacter sp. CACIAM 22H1]|uniref:ABC transporter permease n=1 Tax=Flavihumibacter sp. CACIAM 22H1 TaxID=1812911 RepID=UPI0007A82F81|nr:FtsX-like permease family protein [Flavihumibacter sp. CACIAM 22H1]KYP13868.1 MAG: ABC transporter permease [Flavihumibacter sp. CACIAM 22H1]
MNSQWILKMAWRDSRRNSSRLFLFISSIILGIAALVAIYGLGYTLERDIDLQAKTLVGADLAIDANQPPDPVVQQMLDSIAGFSEQAVENNFASMIYFTRTGGTRLAQVRAVSGGFPFYGTLDTRPANAFRAFRQQEGALVERTLLLQFNAQVGDSIRVGEKTYRVLGEILQSPGKTGFSAAVAPAVWIPKASLEATGLLQKGSRINYLYYYKFNTPSLVTEVVPKIEPRLQDAGWEVETVASRKESTGRSFRDLNEFLQLVSFVALLLGCIGVASAVHIYVREKIRAIAILKCLGATNRQAFLIYLVQMLAIGLLGSMLGALLGTGIQFLLPGVLKDFLPIELHMQVSWKAIAQGLLVGMLVSLLFALWPLLAVRKVSPLHTLRVTEQKNRWWQDPYRLLVGLAIIAFIFGFSWLQTGTVQAATGFTIGVFLSFLLLSGAAWLLIYLIRRFFPNQLAYVWRQGFANLFRPNNQTVILVVAIGLGTSFICLLFYIQGLLTGKLQRAGSENQPNLVVFDIQPAQKDALHQLTANYKLPIIQDVPIITMRLSSIRGYTAADLKADTTLDIPRRAFDGEIRATYRDTLTEAETLVKGILQDSVTDFNDIRISIEEGYAKRLNVEPGDELVFNVQGAPIKTKIGSIRSVDWNRVQTNFRVIFPKGVLEKAPKFHVLVTRVPSAEFSAKYQRALVEKFPTVSVIDLNLILKTVDDILDKIGFVIQFIGGFSIVTGIMVLIASILISKYQRMQETVLLRTLGATSRQVFAITALEYFFLGSLAALTGIGLALIGGALLANFSFDTSFHPPLLATLLIFLSITGLTVLIGLFNSRAVLKAPPLSILNSGT